MLRWKEQSSNFVNNVTPVVGKPTEADENKERCAGIKDTTNTQGRASSVLLGFTAVVALGAWPNVKKMKS